MLGLLEEVLLERRPDVVLVYGDTNTTLAAALAAAKSGVPLAHVEAGLRSFDRTMPEEVNRVVTDHVADLLLCPTETAVRNLAAEGITTGVSLVGDVMLDTARFYAERIDDAAVLGRLDLAAGDYALATVHRAATADDPAALASVIEAFSQMAGTVLWPVHPRTRASLERFGLLERAAATPGLRLTGPLPYGDTVALLRNAALLLTDSGGMQKEAYFFRVPCVTLRDTTEWVETVELGWNRLAGTDPARIAEAVSAAWRPEAHPDVYGDGHAAGAVVRALEACLG
jgi:UDP-N-acetylglucosamine 2-epimerase